MIAVAFAPGRVNLIGEHTDYNGGLSLPLAIGLGVTVRATALDGEEVVARAADYGEEDRFALHAPAPARGWRAFVRGAVAELAAAGLPVRAAELEIAGDVPIGAGLASSAALEGALCLALLALSGADDVDRLALARICSLVEHRWVGAQTGLLDQTVSLLASEGEALRIDFSTLDVEHVPLALGDWRLVSVDSGEAHAHRESGYNERRAECARAAVLLGVETLSEATLDDAARLPDPLDRRARHVLAENARVDATVEALRAGDLAAVGTLLDASHASLRDDYEASTSAVERTVAALRETGAAGARMVGGGFGGHVLALLPSAVAAPPGALEVAPAAGARVVSR